ncbi:MAG: hypothetical protein JWL76_1096 [Thermoleophilia bacterium]|nr:hypothetical protein [Thermoleophilia bacterium]
MNSIPPNILKIGGGVLAAGAGIGAVALSTKLTADKPEGRQLVSGLLAGAGGLAVAGAVLARNTSAFGPLLGAGLGLAGAGIVDAVRGGGTKAAPTAPAAPSRIDGLGEGTLLPDGIQAAPTDVYRQGNEVRFDSVVGNGGAAPLQLALHFDDKAGSSRTTQVLFNEDGTAKERDLQGGLRLDERRDHSHLHFDDFVYFQMYKADDHGRPVPGSEIDGGVKQSFYITDIQQFEVEDRKNREAAAKLAEKGKVDRNIVDADVAQGISVGMADVYGAGLEGQNLSLGDAKPGRYVLRQAFDPSDEVLEQDERNNVADTLIEVGADGKVTTISSAFAPAEDYVTLPDGRVVIPSVTESLDKARSAHAEGADHED